MQKLLQQYSNGQQWKQEGFITKRLCWMGGNRQASSFCALKVFAFKSFSKKDNGKMMVINVCAAHNAKKTETFLLAQKVP